ncbi:WD40-repeat-containing domain protein [Irpex rosettiformis]|uniref:WD40-repeat-containing domain protein n=1 Tax=Irpex rosettiformis TaxID=378272 RepID=A0ACB8UFM6_9APHY|nr:WD40-repeat-containing domain protein [Irpex rosettiformis]
MAENEVIDVDDLELIESKDYKEPDPPRLDHHSVTARSGNPATSSARTITRATKVVYDVVDSDEDNSYSNRTASSKRQPSINHDRDQPVAGPSRQLSVQSNIANTSTVPHKGDGSDPDDIVELTLIPKGAKPGSSKSASHERRNKSKSDQQRRRSELVSIVIEDSDDETETVHVTQNMVDDSDGEYDILHAGLDLNDRSNWTQLELAKNYERFQDDHNTELDINLSAEALSRAAPNVLKRYMKANRRIRRTAHASPYLPPEELLSPAGFEPTWVRAQKAAANSPIGFCRERNDSPLRSNFRHGPLSRFKNLRTTAHKHFSPGPINSITQSNGMIAIASCVLWDINSIEDSGRIYNRDASLKLLYGDIVVRLQVHSSETPEGLRYHTVNEAHFDPTEEYRLVSCGTDGQVIISDCSGVVDGEPPEIVRKFRLEGDRRPSGVSFQPDSPIFAAWDSQGYIRIHKTNNRQFFERKVCRTEDSQPVQALIWGRERTGNMVFASTASEVWNDHSGYHKVFDAESGAPLRAFNNQNAGECLDVNPRGNELALVTCGTEQLFELSMYDIRSRELSRSIQLDRLPHWYEENDENRTDSSVNKLPSTINQVSYSSDGVYIALARSDNAVHVYDSRFLNRRLYNFRHNWGSEGTLDDLKYGVYQIQWVDCPNTGKLSLISGGADGCVRLWDLTAGRSRLWYTEDGAVLAQSESYAGWFSLGDPAKGEKPLILGDGGGSVVIRDLYE